MKVKSTKPPRLDEEEEEEEEDEEASEAVGGEEKRRGGVRKMHRNIRSPAGQLFIHENSLHHIN